MAAAVAAAYQSGGGGGGMGKIIRTRRDRRELQRRLFVAAVASFVAINVYILLRPTATASGVLEHLPTQAGEGAHRCVGPAGDGLH